MQQEKALGITENDITQWQNQLHNIHNDKTTSIFRIGDGVGNDNLGRRIGRLVGNKQRNLKTEADILLQMIAKTPDIKSPLFAQQVKSVFVDHGRLSQERYGALMNYLQNCDDINKDKQCTLDVINNCFYDSELYEANKRDEVDKLLNRNALNKDNGVVAKELSISNGLVKNNFYNIGRTDDFYSNNLLKLLRKRLKNGDNSSSSSNQELFDQIYQKLSYMYDNLGQSQQNNSVNTFLYKHLNWRNDKNTLVINPFEGCDEILRRYNLMKQLDTRVLIGSRCYNYPNGTSDKDKYILSLLCDLFSDNKKIPQDSLISKLLKDLGITYKDVDQHNIAFNDITDDVKGSYGAYRTFGVPGVATEAVAKIIDFTLKFVISAVGVALFILFFAVPSLFALPGIIPALLVTAMIPGLVIVGNVILQLISYGITKLFGPNSVISKAINFIAKAINLIVTLPIKIIVNIVRYVGAFVEKCVIGFFNLVKKCFQLISQAIKTVARSTIGQGVKKHINKQVSNVKKYLLDNDKEKLYYGKTNLQGRSTNLKNVNNNAKILNKSTRYQDPYKNNSPPIVPKQPNGKPPIVKFSQLNHKA